MRRFQSTLPARGATGSVKRIRQVRHISIHAPRTGSDSRMQMARGVVSHFNPRSPHGERRPSRVIVCAGATFQSTLPARGATFLPPPSSPARAIFQSTLPARGATPDLLVGHVAVLISIHAPRTGSDLLRRQPFGCLLISIHAPRTGSDNAEDNADAPSAISIHAPRTGSDRSTASCPSACTNFNPRSPHGERP